MHPSAHARPVSQRRAADDRCQQTQRHSHDRSFMMVQTSASVRPDQPGESPPAADPPITITRIELPLRTILRVLLIIGVLWLFGRLWSIALLLLIAAFLAIAINPAVA